jgi:uncharacterized protein (DUF2252 family)
MGASCQRTNKGRNSANSAWKEFWALTPIERKEISKIFKESRVRRLITSLKGRNTEDQVEVLDAAYWVKGWSSLGRLRFSVLIGIGKRKKRKKMVSVLLRSKKLFARRPQDFELRKCPEMTPKELFRAHECYRHTSEKECSRGGF